MEDPAGTEVPTGSFSGWTGSSYAALHPVDFDARDKFDVAAGWGHYRGSNSMALGAFYRPDERTMFSLGGAFGNGENMMNAGVTFKLDKLSPEGMHPIVSKVQLVKEVQQLKRDNSELKKSNESVLRDNADLKKSNEAVLKDNAELKKSNAAILKDNADLRSEMNELKKAMEAIKQMMRK